MPTSRAWRATVCLASLLSLACVCATPAQAALRAGSVTDPVDQPPSLSGPQPNDVVGVAASFDDATATISVAVTLTRPWIADAPGSGFRATFGSSWSTGYCGLLGGGGTTATLVGSLNPTDTAPGLLSLSTYTGSSSASRSVSPDGLTTTFTASNPALAGLNFICAGTMALVGNDAMGHCVDYCKYIDHEAIVDQVNDFTFAGFLPQQPSEVDDDVPTGLVASRARLHLWVSAALGCHFIGADLSLSSSSDEPLDINADLALKGTRGAGTGTRRHIYDIKPKGTRYFKNLRAGLYQVTLRYAGDQWRRPSRTTARIRVC